MRLTGLVLACAELALRWLLACYPDFSGAIVWIPHHAPRLTNGSLLHRSAERYPFNVSRRPIFSHLFPLQ
jgi:hypothetical protein